MSKFTGDKIGVGVGLESTRGTAASPAVWFKRMDNTFIPMFEKQDETGAMGRLADSSGSYKTKERAEGNIGGEIYPTVIGYFLKSLLGSVATTGSGPYTHTFSLNESNTHQTLTLGVETPLGDYAHANAVIESFNISGSIGDKVKVTMVIKAKKGESQTYTKTYTTEKPFIITDMMIYLADTEAGLDAADNICLNSFDVTITNNLETIECMSDIEPKDRSISNMNIEGSLEMYFESEAYRTKALNGDYQAMRIEIIDGDVDLGSGTNPELTIDLPMISYTNWTPAYTIDAIVKQTLGFKAHDNGTKFIEAKLVNTQSSY